MAQINVFNFERTLDQRVEEVVEYLSEYFDPAQGDTFLIIDPYLEPLLHLQKPFDDNIVEQNVWAFFISIVADQNEEIYFQIITTRKTNELKNPDGKHPKTIFNPSILKKVKVEVCSFKDGDYNSHSLHDRWILKSSKTNKLSGIHVGPSLSDIDKKDATITIFGDNIIQEITNRFNYLWNICLRKQW